MSSTKFFRFPWATSGDKTSIPDIVPPTGAVSYPQGFGPDYTRDPAFDPAAKRVPRRETNQIYYDVTTNIQAWQLAGLPEWVEASQNGGTAITYARGACVRHDQSGAFLNYVALVATNTEPGTSSDWSVLASLEDINETLGLSDTGLPYFLELNNNGETAQSIPPFVATRCNNMLARQNNMPAGSWDGTTFTATAETAGVYGVLNRLNTQNENGEGAQTRKNGLNIRNYQLSATAGTSNVVPFTHFVQLRDGDTLEFYHLHQSDGPRDNLGSEAQIYRLLKIQPGA